MTATPFRGTVTYSSEEMVECFQNGDIRLIDLYYNDAHCLRVSMREIEQN